MISRIGTWLKGLWRSKVRRAKSIFFEAVDVDCAQNQCNIFKVHTRRNWALGA